MKIYWKINLCSNYTHNMDWIEYKNTLQENIKYILSVRLESVINSQDEKISSMPLSFIQTYNLEN